MKRIWLNFIFILLICSCGSFLLHEDFKDGDWFYLENKGAIMPVWVKGNKQSNVFLLLLHGGPGDSAMYYSTTDAFNKLEKDYAVVYWDQRMSGTAQGNAKPESINMEQFVDDLKKVVTLIRHKYNNPSLFLMGHSWGGTLGTAFLINPDNQTHISGWIEMNGGHNLKGGLIHSKEWAIEKAEEQISLGKEVNYWRKELAWYDNIIFSDLDTVLKHYENLHKLNAYYVDPLNAFEAPISWLFNSPYSVSVFLNPYFGIKYNKFDLWDINFVPEMNKIIIPSLILWGRHDGVFPIALAHEAFENIGSENKYLQIFEFSAHNPCFEEPELFTERVLQFNDKYK